MVLHRVFCPYTSSKQNGLAEKKHSHIVEMGLGLLAEYNLSKGFWDDAFFTIVFIINRFPTPILKLISPFEYLLNQSQII